MKIFRTKIFRRNFFIYSIIIIVTLLLLSQFFISNIKKNTRNNQIYLNEKMIDNISDYLQYLDKSSKHLLDIIYNNPGKLSDLVNFLNYETEDYMKSRLDSYLNSDKTYYEGIDFFVRNCFDSDEDIENVIFYSNRNDKLIIYNSYMDISYFENISKIIQGKRDKKAIEIPMNKNHGDLFNRLVHFLNSINNNDSKKYYYIIKPIMNPSKLDIEGILVIKYNINKIQNIIKSYSKVKNDILLINSRNIVIYDSSNKYTNKTYPYADKLKNTDEPIMVDQLSYVGIRNNDIVHNRRGIRVVGVLPAENVKEDSKLAISMIYILTILLVLIAEIFIYIRLKYLSNRIEKIIYVMKEIQRGNLNININSDNENDEFTMISDNLNDTCRKLNEYINKVYLSEIKQKNAEIIALQSQINPHFLYNTLESIRMKAVINEDKEVAKMLYSLAFLFRNMTKSDNLITLKQELEHCRLYLDLFKFRYEGVFEYKIDIDDELLEKKIIKFSIQPIIENFIVHGIKLEENDNFVWITVKKKNYDIEISIKDNGNGIEPEKMKIIIDRLENLDNRESIGLINVHERIRLIYGEKYGLTIKNNDLGGTTVIIKISSEEVD